MSKANNPQLPVPSLASTDTLAALLQQLPAEAAAQFGETVSYLKDVSAIQQKRMEALDRQKRYEALISSVIEGVDTASPGSIAGLHVILAPEARRGLVAPEGSFAEIETKVATYLSNPPVNTEQTPLPDFKGLPALVDMFKQECVRQIQKTVAKLPNRRKSERFSDACFSLVRNVGTYTALHEWNKSGEIFNVFNVCGAANQAANVLRSLADDPKSAYPQSIGQVDCERLAKRIHEEITESRAKHAVAALSPEDTLRAVELLRSEKAATPRKSSP